MKLKNLIFFSTFTIVYSQLLITNNGPCNCDITANICDINCCCDSSCSSLQIQSFSCPYDQISPLAYGCFPTELLFQNNTAFLNVTIGNLYCIYQDNYTLRNFYFTPTNFLLTDITAIADYNDMPSIYSSFNYLSVFSSQTYTVGAPIYTLLVRNFMGILSISRPDLSSNCVDGLPIGYMTNEIVTCTQTIGNIATSCGTMAGVSNYWVSGMVVPSYPSIMITQFTILPNVPVSQYFAAVTCNNCNGPTSPSYNAAGAGTCNNVVTGVVYEIQGETNISAVIITLTTANINANFNKTFSVTFKKTGYNSSASTYSGTPGYIAGYPVKTVATGTPKNLIIISGGACNGGTTAPILFGVNSYTDCNISTTSVGTSALLINTFVTTALNPYLVSSVSAYGNLSTDNQVPRTTNDDSSSSNTLTVTKLTIYFIYARTGTLTSPQNKIIGYQTTYSYDTVTTTGQQYWVTIAVKFIDNSLALFDIDSEVSRLKAGNTVRDFLYLLYVENKCPGVARWSVGHIMMLVIVAVLRWA